jgi:hypothetical protein
MRNLLELDGKEEFGIIRMNVELPDECYRNKDAPVNNALDGQFVIDHRGNKIVIIASTGQGWDHVSVSLADRCPTWEEMELVAKLFFLPTEYAMQLHVPASDHINDHPFTLHWWRPRSKLKKIPLPPKSLV